MLRHSLVIRRNAVTLGGAAETAGGANTTLTADTAIGALTVAVAVATRIATGRYLRIGPVIDGVEGDFTKTDGLPAAAIRLIGNVPPNGKAPGGLLRHKGWKAEKVDLPASTPGQILTPAEIEVE